MNRLSREWKHVVDYLADLPWWLWVGVRRKDFVWEAANQDDPIPFDYREPWNKRMWMAVRPHYRGLLKRLPCGCSRRLGRMVLFNMDCPVHGITREENG